MRILVLSFYYPPDIGPGPLRAKSIVDSLLAVGGKELHIDVMTTLPNRYSSLNASASMIEDFSQISISRIALPEHKSGMADQAVVFAKYALSVVQRVRGRQWDIVVSTSSRLMTASLGAWVAKRCGAMLYLDIRDLFTDNVDSLMAKSPVHILLPVFKLLERWTFNSADKLNVVSAGFFPHVKNIAPSLMPTVFTNGIDPVFIKTDFSQPISSLKPTVLYAGNIGEGQGLHHIIPDIAKEMPHVRFQIIGDGGRVSILKKKVVRSALTNVEILNPVERCILIEAYRDADVLFLHLNDYNALHKVLPSKIFEYAATGKPILAGVTGYAAEFLCENIPEVEVFNPCDSHAMRLGLERLLAGPRVIDRSGFCTVYLRQNIMEQMARSIMALGKELG